MSEQKSWLSAKKEIQESPLWMKEGEKVEIVYGNWKEISTKRKNRKTGEEYESRDFELDAKDTQGKQVKRLVNKYLFVNIIEKFESEYPPHKNQSIEDYEKYLTGKSIIFRRPMTTA